MKTLDVEQLSTHYLTKNHVLKAVDKVDLCVDKGKIVGLVGESGCGKSTLARSIVGLVPPPGKIVNGKIFFQGRNLVELSDVERRPLLGKEISMVFQDPTEYLNPVMTIGSQINEVLEVHSLPSDGRVVETLRQFQIPSPEKVVNMFPHQLSGGMRQRVLLSIAFIGEPDFIIMDEPTTSLDVTVAAKVASLIKERVAESDVSVLYVSHDLGVVASIADEVYVMYAGNMVESGDVFSVFLEPMHPYTSALITAAKGVYGESPQLTAIEGSVPNLDDLPNGCLFHPRCKKRMEQCEKQHPPIFRISDRDVRCWLLYEGNGP